MRNRLGVRLAILIVIIGPLMFFVFMNIVYLANYLLGESELHNAFWILTALIVTPLTMGMTAAWYVNRRLRKFAEGVLLLRTNDYSSAVPLSGIREFDDVIKEFNLLQQRLRKEEELRKNLISDTSHELNTPLAAMLSQITAMRENVLKTSPDRLQTLQEQTERLIDMVRQLDEYTAARLPAHNHESLALHMIGLAVGKQLATVLHEAKMKLVADVGPDFRLVASRAALEQILTNIIYNAAKYSRGDKITITVTKDGFAVSDNGIGVSSADREHLFERFYRVEKSRNRRTGGLGLGLAIVQELATQQGWKVHAEDANPGLRIHFIVT